MSNGDIILLAVAGYIAVISLVRLMRQRRDQLYRELAADIEQARLRERRQRPADDRRAQQEKAA
jgi:hypothetical protein